MEFFYPGKLVPPVVTLCDYDIWAFKYGEDTNRLQTGIRLYDTRPESMEWHDWLKSSYWPKEEIEKVKLPCSIGTNLGQYGEIVVIPYGN